jgi:predicted GIY-YIG superfamily endonuclease
MGQTATQVNHQGINIIEGSNDSPKNVSTGTGKELYVLKLERGKYYVGITNDVNKRYNQHLSDVGSEWTKKYKVVCLEYVKELTHVLDEDMEVKKLMMVYGIENVRGGTYSKVILDQGQIDSLSREYEHATSKCFKCKKTGHYAIDCNIKTLVHIRTIKPKSQTKQSNPKPTCFRCGRNTHTMEECKAKTLLSGVSIINLNYCRDCGRKDHSKEKYSTFKCRYKTNRDGNCIDEHYCEKCGRIGHSVIECTRNNYIENSI